MRRRPGPGKPWADLHEIRGVARAGRGDFAGAIDDYSQALELRPGQPRVLTLRGLAYLVSDAPRLALRDFDAALRLDAFERRGPRRPGPGAGPPGRPPRRGRRGRGIAPPRSATQCAAGLQRRPHLRPGGHRGGRGGRRKGPLAVRLVERYQDRAVALVKAGAGADPGRSPRGVLAGQVATDPALRPLQRRLRSLQPAGAANSP